VSALWSMERSAKVTSAGERMQQRIACYLAQTKNA